MENNQRIAVLGASGAIGQAFVHYLAGKEQVDSIEAFSKQPVTFDLPNVQTHHIDYNDENAIAAAAAAMKDKAPFTQVIVATGILHTDSIQPEKSLKALTESAFQQVFYANTLFPALVAKHFLPLMDRKKPTIFAALSARVGSISDNRLGGWYSYRASKAALNMMIKNIALEMRTKQPYAVIVGLHPGTVDSNLSAPFQKHVPQEKLFTADYAVEQLCGVLEQLTPNDSGKCFDYQGLMIDP